MKKWDDSTPMRLKDVLEAVEKIKAFKKDPAPTIAIPVVTGSIIGKRITCATEAEHARAALYGLRVRIDGTVGLTQGGIPVLCWLAGHEVLVHPARAEAFEACFEDASK